MTPAILIDVTRCTGCERCVAACIKRNELDPLRAETDRATGVDGLSANRWSTIVQVDRGRFARKSCMHCEEPSCVSACLVGGLTKTDAGPVVYDDSKCIGCRYCMLACPFHIPRYEWDETIPYVRKCDMCFERLQDGQKPACVEACPNEALLFGDRNDLLGVARDRINRDPQYKNHVWGETEFGGTSVLYVSDVDLAGLGWPEHLDNPISALTDPLIHMTPVIGMTVAFGSLGLSWIIRRRMTRASEADGEDGEHDAKS
ncbi:MAG: 4Fe-4S dicluster domain-containing protein [candidate division Zixibacteria bacterium]|nr:4Fe-4S dicluster domain-containing protein [candidate division Zixibacteria bacterium]